MITRPATAARTYAALYGPRLLQKWQRPPSQWWPKCRRSLHPPADHGLPRQVQALFEQQNGESTPGPGIRIDRLRRLRPRPLSRRNAVPGTDRSKQGTRRKEVVRPPPGRLLDKFVQPVAVQEHRMLGACRPASDREQPEGEAVEARHFDHEAAVRLQYPPCRRKASKRVESAREMPHGNGRTCRSRAAPVEEATVKLHLACERVDDRSLKSRPTTCDHSACAAAAGSCRPRSRRRAPSWSRPAGRSGMRSRPSARPACHRFAYTRSKHPVPLFPCAM